MQNLALGALFQASPMANRRIPRASAGLLAVAIAGCSAVPGLSEDWRLAACYADQPGVAVIEVFEVAHVSDLFGRMNGFDRQQVQAGTDERPAVVVRLRGKLKVEQPAVGPMAGRSVEANDPTCLLVLAPDGTFPEGETPLFLGPIAGD